MGGAKEDARPWGISKNFIDQGTPSGTLNMRKGWPDIREEGTAWVCKPQGRRGHAVGGGGRQVGSWERKTGVVKGGRAGPRILFEGGSR